MGKLCASFGTRREAHALAVYYMDKYMLLLGKDVSAKQLKLISMTALLVALKVDDGIMSRRICHEYIHKMDQLLANNPKLDQRGRSMNKAKEMMNSGMSSR